jgi:hypothetical protein
MAVMSVETWDIDQAVTRGQLDEELDGCRSVDRYGVTGREEVRGEPLEVALAQEEPDARSFAGVDDQWVFVDDGEIEGLLDSLDGDGPEAAAMHVVTL